ncbi:hypothetical protein BpHYR1_011848 [Brachionus plicatilis]|uniref:Uncharacterized protein n=1 Tax=Brachionus plicatilis TaxID=10195 RepID=A0A3M7RD82_BRAPC|nr:hypothetical protein BpHYR1_011848 [Brachionus plicatilis]
MARKNRPDPPLCLLRGFTRKNFRQFDKFQEKFNSDSDECMQLHSEPTSGLLIAQIVSRFKPFRISLIIDLGVSFLHPKYRVPFTVIGLTKNVKYIVEDIPFHVNFKNRQCQKQRGY